MGDKMGKTYGTGKKAEDLGEPAAEGFAETIKKEGIRRYYRSD